MTQADRPPVTPDRQKQIEESLNSVRQALTSLRFGTISLTVHDDRVVQIDITEKKRFAN